MARRVPEDHTVRRRWAIQMQRPLPASTLFDRTVFLVGTASAVWMAAIIGLQGFSSPWAVLLLVPVWAITAYLVLPRLHRMLPDLYVPDYFFGRTRTADGLLGDPVNLAVDGSAAQLDWVMTKGGWHRADEITAASTWGIVVSTLTRRSYPTAPVSPLMLFGRRHDVAYQQEVEGNPKQRHHVRFWHCPPDWPLPGGTKVGWLGAGTYDTDVGLSLFTLQLTHRIDENTDIERDYVVSSAQSVDAGVTVQVLRDFTTGYHSRNGGGDRFVTDGDLPIIDVSEVAVDTTEPQTAGSALRDPVHRAPLTVIAAVVIVVVGGVVDLLRLILDPEVQAGLARGDEAARLGIGAVLGVGAALTLAQIVMAWFVLRRGRRSRAVLMLLLVLGIAVTATSYLSGEEALRFDGTLVMASLSCLALVALSGDSAGAWSRQSQVQNQVQNQDPGQRGLGPRGPGQAGTVE